MRERLDENITSPTLSIKSEVPNFGYIHSRPESDRTRMRMMKLGVASFLVCLVGCAAAADPTILVDGDFAVTADFST